MEDVESLGKFLLSENMVTDRQGKLDGPWLEWFMGQMQTVAHRLERLHYKSMGAMLSFQESITTEKYAPNTPQ